jgi:hypothetical protein
VACGRRGAFRGFHGHGQKWANDTGNWPRSWNARARTGGKLDFRHTSTAGVMLVA